LVPFSRLRRAVSSRDAFNKLFVLIDVGLCRKFAARMHTDSTLTHDRLDLIISLTKTGWTVKTI
jgi:hypothetical protein